MPTDANDPTREPTHPLPIDPADPPPDPPYPPRVVAPGTTRGRVALIQALARILVRLDSAAQIMPQSPTPPLSDESNQHPE